MNSKALSAPPNSRRRRRSSLATWPKESGASRAVFRLVVRSPAASPVMTYFLAEELCQLLDHIEPTLSPAG